MSLPNTRWTLLAKLSVPENRGPALEALCTEYWRPVYAFLRGRGYAHEEAEDLTQGFFELVVRDGLFQRANRQEGKLRSYLLGALENYAANASRTRAALKRGGGHTNVSLHEPVAIKELETLSAGAPSPAEAFDRAWLAMLLQRVVGDLRREYEGAGKAPLFAALLPSLLDGETQSQAEAAAAAGMSVANFRVQLHRLRMRYRDALQREIAATLGEGDGSDIGAEMQYLYDISRAWA